jgi:hypothetical protein
LMLVSFFAVRPRKRTANPLTCVWKTRRTTKIVYRAILFHVAFAVCFLRKMHDKGFPVCFLPLTCVSGARQRPGFP